MRTFTIVIPGFSNDIRPTLASILQQYKPADYEMRIEVIIVNDNVEHRGQYDSIIESFSSLSPDWISWKVIENEKNVGQGLSRQYGIDAATTDYVQLLDDDDQLSPGFVYKVSDNIDVHIAQTKRDDVAMVTIPVMS